MPTGQTIQPVFTLNASNNAVWSKNMPFAIMLLTDFLNGLSITHKPKISGLKTLCSLDATKYFFVQTVIHKVCNGNVASGL